jgi:hypothetical protein
MESRLASLIHHLECFSSAREEAMVHFGLSWLEEELPWLRWMYSLRSPFARTALCTPRSFEPRSSMCITCIEMYLYLVNACSSLRGMAYLHR